MTIDHDKNFLHALWALDRDTKTKVLVVASAVTMVIVVYFWIGYINNSIAGIAQQVTVADQPAGQDAATPAAIDDVGPWTHMENSMAFALGQFGGIFRGIGNLFQAPRQYDVTPQSTQDAAPPQ